MRLLLDVSAMRKHIQQRRRVLMTLLLLTVFLLLRASPSRTFTRFLDSYITSDILWIDTSSKTPCWKTAPALYHCFRSLTPGSTYSPLRSPTQLEALMVPIQPWHPSHCIDEFFTKGEPCSARRPTTLDVVWTWVNGSDVLFQQALLDAANFLDTWPRKNTIGVTNARLYR
jgi:hypothetical protein